MPQVPTNPEEIVSHHKSMFGTLDILPRGLEFQTQNEGERVFVKTRPHPLVNIGWAMNFSFLAVLPFITYIVFQSIPFNLDSFIPNGYTLIVLLTVYYSMLFTYFLYHFADWYYDLFLVTNERIINIEFSPLKRHRVSEARLRNIEDVSESVVGLLPQLFNYGDVKVQTAANHDLFVFTAVPDPAWFRDVIMDLSKFERDFK